MKFKTILNMPDSWDKFNKLENKLLKLQHHGNDFFEALEEYERLFKVYRQNERNDEAIKAWKDRAA